MKKPGKTGSLDPAAVCKSSDPMAVRELLTKIGDKWSIFLILSLDLLGGRARFSELERAIPGISQRMLSITLKNLERDGLVIRELFPEVPPRVEYEITGLGRSLLRPRKDWSIGPKQIGSGLETRRSDTIPDNLHLLAVGEDDWFIYRSWSASLPLFKLFLRSLQHVLAETFP